MAEKKIPTIYQATDAFYVGGVLINRGDTVIAGHPYLKGRTSLFRKFEPTHGEMPEPEPGPEPTEPEPEESK